MPQIPPISDAYIDEIIKSAGPYVESINKTQGVKLRELIKALRDYFEQEIPKTTSALTNDSNFVSEAVLAGIPEENGQKKPFIIRALAEWDPEEVIGTGYEPVHTMLVATEFINNKYTVTQLKISDGVTAFKDLKNLVLNGVINGGTTGQTLEKQSILNGDASWVDVPQKIADALSLKLNSADYNQHFRGKFSSLSALQGATFNPSLAAGDYAQVDVGTGTDVKNYNWDTDDNKWIEGGSGSAATNTDQLPEGTNNLYFTAQRAIDGVTNDYVHKSGSINESISGKKSFQTAPSFDSLTANQYLKLDSGKSVTGVTSIVANDVAESTTKRFITDTERSNWNGLTVVATGLTSTAGTPTPSDNVVTILSKFKNFYDNAGTTVRDTVLTGLLTTTNAAITATDTVLGGLGKLQAQITAKLTGTLASDAETQISATVTEDNKVVSRLKLFNWWTWVKTQVQTFTAKVTFTAAPRFNSATASTYLKVDANKDLTGVAAIPAADVTESTTKRFITDTERTTWAAKQDAISIATDAEMQAGTNNTKYVTPWRITNWWTWLRTQSSMWTLSFLAGAGNRVVQVNSTGEISTPNVIMDGFVTDPVVISAITDATYNSANGYTANIAPNGVFFYQGQMYKSGQYLYIAILDNTSFRVSGG